MKEFNIFNLSARDLHFLSDFLKLADEAAEAEKAIKERYKTATFALNQQEIQVYMVSSFGEYEGEGYLSVNGRFRYHDNWWGGREWEIYLNEEQIYKVFKTHYLMENGYDSFVFPEDKIWDNFEPILRRFIEQVKRELEYNLDSNF